MTAEQRVALVDAIAALRYRQRKLTETVAGHSELKRVTDNRIIEWERAARTLELMLVGDPSLPAPKAHN